MYKHLSFFLVKHQAASGYGILMQETFRLNIDYKNSDNNQRAP